jgi:hypothetical protein
MDEENTARQYVLALVRAGLTRGEADRFDAFGYLLSRLRGDRDITFVSNFHGPHAAAIWDALGVLVLTGDLQRTVTSSGGESSTSWRALTLPPGQKEIPVPADLAEQASRLLGAVVAVRARSTAAVAVAAKLVYVAGYMSLPADLEYFAAGFNWRLAPVEIRAGVALARALGLLPVKD